MSILSSPGSDLDPNSEKFKTAETKCRSLQPSPKFNARGGE
jgi:hypothetical protein